MGQIGIPAVFLDTSSQTSLIQAFDELFLPSRNSAAVNTSSLRKRHASLIVIVPSDVFTTSPTRYGWLGRVPSRSDLSRKGCGQVFNYVGLSLVFRLLVPTFISEWEETSCYDP